MRETVRFLSKFWLVLVAAVVVFNGPMWLIVLVLVAVLLWGAFGR